ncbi:MAG: TRAP transporter large permease [Mailhella sp.]
MELPLIAMLVTLVVTMAAGLHVALCMSIAAMVCLFLGDNEPVLFTQKFFNTFESFPLLAVPFFIIAGEIMQRGSMAEVLLNLSRAMMQHVRGGLAIVSVMTCMFYGALCGAAPATLAAVGGIMIPAMEKDGYSKSFATAVNASGGALGPLIPPGIAAILFATSAQVSVGDMFMGMLPCSILIAILFMITSYIISRKNNYGHVLPKASAKERFQALWEAKWALMVPILVLGGIYGGITTPTEAGVVAVVYALFAETFITKTMTWKKFREIMVASFKSNGLIMFVVCGANAMGTMLVFYQADAIIVDMVSSITTNPTILMICFIILFLILGTFMEVGSCVLMLTPMIMPLVKSVGIDPVHFGVVFVSTMVIGVITPPVGMNLYMGCAMADIPFVSLCRDVMPFVAAMTVGVLIVAFFPALCLILI